MTKKFYKIFIFLIFFHLGFINSARALEVAVTVDDLPYNGELPLHTTRMDVANKMLHVLQQHHIKKIYGFINAKKVDENKENEKVLTTWMQYGNLLGNHTYSHIDLAKVDIETYLADIEKNDIYLKQLMGDKN